MHVTFLLLLGWAAATHWLAGRTVDAAVNGMAFILALFGCVLLHVLGHSLAARRYGIPRPVRVDRSFSGSHHTADRVQIVGY